MNHRHSIWWNGSTGMAHSDGVHAELRTAPRLLGRALVEIDYEPRSDHCRVHFVGDAVSRKLHEIEVQAVDEKLARMADAARAALV